MCNCAVVRGGARTIPSAHAAGLTTDELNDSGAIVQLCAVVFALIRCRPICPFTTQRSLSQKYLDRIDSFLKEFEVVSAGKSATMITCTEPKVYNVDPKMTWNSDVAPTKNSIKFLSTGHIAPLEKSRLRYNRKNYAENEHHSIHRYNLEMHHAQSNGGCREMHTGLLKTRRLGLSQESIPESKEIHFRLTLTSVAAYFCFLSGHLEKTIFTFPPIVFIGNLSYVIYLIHCHKLYKVHPTKGSNWIDEALLAVALIIGLSLFAHYFVEKKILHLDFSFNITTAFFVFAICYALIPWVQTKECLAMSTLSEQKVDEAKFNLLLNNLVTNITELPCDVFRETVNFTFDITAVEYCVHKGHGNGTVLVIGNSVSIRAFPTIFNLLNGRYEEIRLFARHGSAPLLNISAYYTDAALQMAKDLKPEVLWIIQGMNEIVLHTKDTPYDFSSQNIDKVVSETLDQFKEHAEMVFVDLPYFVTKDYPANLIARSLIYRKGLRDTVGVDLETVGEQVNEQAERLRRSNCSNCEFIDVQKLTKTAFEIVKAVYREKIDEMRME